MDTAKQEMKKPPPPKKPKPQVTGPKPKPGKKPPPLPKKPPVGTTTVGTTQEICTVPKSQSAPAIKHLATAPDPASAPTPNQNGDPPVLHHNLQPDREPSVSSEDLTVESDIGAPGDTISADGLESKTVEKNSNKKQTSSTLSHEKQDSPQVKRHWQKDTNNTPQSSPNTARNSPLSSPKSSPKVKKRPQTRPKPRARTSLGGKGSKEVTRKFLEGCQIPKSTSDLGLSSETNRSGKENGHGSETKSCDTNQDQDQGSQLLKRRSNSYEEAINTDVFGDESITNDSDKPPVSIAANSPTPAPRPKPRSTSKSVGAFNDGEATERPRSKTAENEAEPGALLRPPPRSETVEVLFRDKDRELSPAPLERRLSKPTRKAPPPPVKSHPLPTSKSAGDIASKAATKGEATKSLAKKQTSSVVTKDDEVTGSESIDLDADIPIEPHSELLDSNEYLQPEDRRIKLLRNEFKPHSSQTSRESTGLYLAPQELNPTPTPPPPATSEKTQKANENSGEYSYALLPEVEPSKSESSKTKSRTSIGSHLFDVVFSSKRKSSSSSESGRKSKVTSQFYYAIDDQALDQEGAKTFDPVVTLTDASRRSKDDLDVVVEPHADHIPANCYIPPEEMDRAIPLPGSDPNLHLESSGEYSSDPATPAQPPMPKAPPRMKKKHSVTMLIDIDPLDNVVPVSTYHDDNNAAQQQQQQQQPPALPEKKAKTKSTSAEEEEENEYAYPDVEFPYSDEETAVGISARESSPGKSAKIRPRDQSEPLPEVPCRQPHLPPRRKGKRNKTEAEVPQDESFDDSSSSKAHKTTKKVEVELEDEDAYIIPGQESSDTEPELVGKAADLLDRAVLSDSHSNSSNEYENEYSPIDETSMRESRRTTHVQSVEDIVEGEVEYLNNRKSSEYVDPDSRTNTLQADGKDSTIRSIDSHEYIIPDAEMFAVRTKAHGAVEGTESSPPPPPSRKPFGEEEPPPPPPSRKPTFADKHRPVLSIPPTETTAETTATAATAETTAQTSNLSSQSFRSYREDSPNPELITRIAEELTQLTSPRMRRQRQQQRQRRRLGKRRNHLRKPPTTESPSDSSSSDNTSDDDDEDDGDAQDQSGSRPCSLDEKTHTLAYLTMDQQYPPFVCRQQSRSMENIDTNANALACSSRHEDDADHHPRLKQQLIEATAKMPAFLPAPGGGGDASQSFINNSDYSSGGEGEEAEKQKMIREKLKVFYIAKEIYSSERAFVKVLRMLNQDFRTFIHDVSSKRGSAIVPVSIMDQLYKFLPNLQQVNEDLMRDLYTRVKNWEKDPRIADIFVKKGPFLKLYTSYILNYKNACSTLENARHRYVEFDMAIKAYERGPKCAGLELKHYLLKPIQRIPQYRLLLQDYQKHITEDSPDFKDTQIALSIVSEVADHANHHMKYGDHVSELMEIQNSLIGQFEVIHPGRELLKMDVLDKLSRKEMQPRKFFLFSDVLLYTTPVGNGTGYKVNNALPLAGMRVLPPAREDYENEFNIITTKRSFTVAAKSVEHKAEWMKALQDAITDYEKRRGSHDPRRLHGHSSMMSIELDHTDFNLGSKAPVWIPDKRVTMCMLCTAEFTVLYRRHHCRACGKVVCANCSDFRAPLRYCNNNPERVCEECYNVLLKEVDDQAKQSPDTSTSSLSIASSGSSKGRAFSPANLKSRFERLRFTSFGKGEKGKKDRPAVLKEVVANDESADVSGYLKLWQNKTKGWTKLWFVVKGKVLYTYKASEDTAATQSIPLLGYEVRPYTQTDLLLLTSKAWYFQGIEPSLVFELIHRNMATRIFRTESPMSRDRWMIAMRDATIP